MYASVASSSRTTRQTIIYLMFHFSHIYLKSTFVASKLKNWDAGCHVSKILDMNTERRRKIPAFWGKCFLSMWILFFMCICLGWKVALKRTHEADHPSGRGQDHHHDVWSNSYNNKYSGLEINLFSCWALEAGPPYPKRKHLIFALLYSFQQFSLLSWAANPRRSCPWGLFHFSPSHANSPWHNIFAVFRKACFGGCGCSGHSPSLRFSSSFFFPQNLLGTYWMVTVAQAKFFAQLSVTSPTTYMPWWYRDERRLVFQTSLVGIPQFRSVLYYHEDHSCCRTLWRLSNKLLETIVSGETTSIEVEMDAVMWYWRCFHVLPQDTAHANTLILVMASFHHHIMDK